MDTPKSSELLRVAKFGGTSLSHGENIKISAGLVIGDKTRRYIVVSAPGKRFNDDKKITDMLYEAYDAEKDHQKNILNEIEKRFLSICEDLKIELDVAEIFDNIRLAFFQKKGRDYAASRGEYLMGIIFAKYIGYEFIDAAEVIFFSKDGSFNSEKTNETLKTRLKNVSLAVIPGFYGSLPCGNVKTFSRGGSDITGALVARAVSADVYENFTDVDGFMMADPRIVEKPRVMEQVTYDQLRELAYMGATVLHEDSIYPVKASGIPINIKNTFKSDLPGTVIVSKSDNRAPRITGIAGKKGFSSINIKLNMSRSDISENYKLALEVFRKFELQTELITVSGGGITFILSNLRDKLQKIEDESDTEYTLEDIKTENGYIVGIKRTLLQLLFEAISPESILIKNGLSLIAIVGENITRDGMLILSRMQENECINPEFILKAPRQSSIVIGVDTPNFESTIRKLYTEISKL